MPKLSEQFGFDPELKKEITKEGSEKEIGKTENVKSYLGAHKEIALPKEEIKKPDLLLEIEENKRLGWFEGSNNGFSSLTVLEELYYIDKKGNINRVKLDLEKISSISEKFPSIPKNYYKKSPPFRPGESTLERAKTREAQEDSEFHNIWYRIRNELEKELSQLGFRILPETPSAQTAPLYNLREKIKSEVSQYQKELEKEIAGKKTKKEEAEFDF